MKARVIRKLIQSSVIQRQRESLASRGFNIPDKILLYV